MNGYGRVKADGFDLLFKYINRCYLYNSKSIKFRRLGAFSENFRFFKAFPQGHFQAFFH